MKKKSSKSAFFNPRFLIGLVICVAGVLLALVAYTLLPGGSVQAQFRPSQVLATRPGWQVVVSSYNGETRPLREVDAAWPPDFSQEAPREANKNPQLHDRPQHDHDTVVQDKHNWLGRLAPSIPGPILNFPGIPFPGFNCNCAPPDTNGEAGATQYVQVVNKGYQVFDKFTGASVLGPLAIGAIWQADPNYNGVCETGSGDPVVLYDQLADRWLISQFAGSGTINHECIAISKTGDATGAYFVYDFNLGNNFFDYPHIGVWPDAYYMSDNVFNAQATAFLGTQAFAFDRAKMLCGLPVSFITPGLTPGGANNEAFLPADLDGNVLPPPGAPNVFVEFPTTPGNGLRYKHWRFHVDFGTPANSTFTPDPGPAAAPYTTLGFNDSVPQAGTTQRLDGLSDRSMFRSAYRNYGTPQAPNESLVGNFSVLSNGVAGVRWFEFKNVTSGPLTINQESTYQPDTAAWRWMGSAAMDHSGNFAIGFSASNTNLNPQIRYAGRLSSDPPNNLAQGEALMFAGTGSQTGTGGRWGDYSDLVPDPIDDTTMWYTTEYYDTTSSFNWRTRIGSFRINANQPLLNVAAKSRRIHGVAGPFDINLPLAGTRGVECRRGGGANNNDYTIVFNFTNSVTSVGGASSSCGGAAAAIAADNHQVIASLTNVTCNAQYITVTLNNVSDGTNTISPSVTFGLLVGDTTGNGAVNASDVSQVKSQSGMATCPSNFRLDLTVDGDITASDVGFAKTLSGNLPTPP